MKQVLFKDKVRAFEAWRRMSVKEYGKYIWPQINYDWTTCKTINIVFEKNNHNKTRIIWPVSLKGVKCFNLDFTGSVPLNEYGKPWDYNNFHTELGCSKLKNLTNLPNNFWNYRLQTRPPGNLCCDIDCLETTKSSYVGFEATDIFEVEPKERAIMQFKRAIRLRKNTFPGGDGYGFNTKQLKAQYNFINLVGGELYIIFHLTPQDSTGYYYVDGEKILVVKITDEVLDEFDKINKLERDMDVIDAYETKLEKYISFNSLDTIFTKVGNKEK